MFNKISQWIWMLLVFIETLSWCQGNLVKLFSCLSLWKLFINAANSTTYDPPSNIKHPYGDEKEFRSDSLGESAQIMICRNKTDLNEKERNCPSVVGDFSFRVIWKFCSIFKLGHHQNTTVLCWWYVVYLYSISIATFVLTFDLFCWYFTRGL